MLDIHMALNHVAWHSSELANKTLAVCIETMSWQRASPGSLSDAEQEMIGHRARGLGDRGGVYRVCATNRAACPAIRPVVPDRVASSGDPVLRSASWYMTYAAVCVAADDATVDHEVAAFDPNEDNFQRMSFLALGIAYFSSRNVRRARDTRSAAAPDNAAPASMLLGGTSDFIRGAVLPKTPPTRTMTRTMRAIMGRDSRGRTPQYRNGGQGPARSCFQCLALSRLAVPVVQSQI